MAQFNFDTATVEKRESNYELLPAGWYVGQVTDSEIVPLKTGNGKALKLTVEILTESYRGRKVWARLNVQHTNSEAERISQQQLRELCDAIGLNRMTDTVQLHNQPFGVKLKIRDDKSGQYEPQNEVAGFKPATGSAPASMGAKPPQMPANAPGAAAGTSTPPWAKRAA